MENYEILGTIGEGTYGVVLKARHKETGRVVAIKKFKESEEDEQVKKTGLREVRILKQLKHNNIVSLLEVFRRPRDRKLFLVFEYVERTILEILEKHPYGLDDSDVQKYTYQLLCALQYCHQNKIIHRDVKPENILISKSGILKLCDFGFARTMGGNGTKYTDYVATRWYRSPELLVGDPEYHQSVDIWAVGCMTAEISTGVPLFPGESDLDQLHQIIKTTGRLTSRQLSAFKNNPLYTGLDLPEPRTVETIEKKLSGSIGVRQLLVMLKCCLVNEPLHRMSCNSLLKHPYFSNNNFLASFSENFKKMKEEEDIALQAQMGAHIRPKSAIYDGHTDVYSTPTQKPSQQLKQSAVKKVVTETVNQFQSKRDRSPGVVVPSTESSGGLVSNNKKSKQQSNKVVLHRDKIDNTWGNLFLQQHRVPKQSNEYLSEILPPEPPAQAYAKPVNQRNRKDKVSRESARHQQLFTVTGQSTVIANTHHTYACNNLPTLRKTPELETSTPSIPPQPDPQIKTNQYQNYDKCVFFFFFL